jgi:hypothetical protein
MRQDLDGRGFGLIEVLSRSLPRGTLEIRKTSLRIIGVLAEI